MGSTPKVPKEKRRAKVPKAKGLVQYESHELVPKPIDSVTTHDVEPPPPLTEESLPTGESLASRIARRRLERSGAETPLGSSASFASSESLAAASVPATSQASLYAGGMEHFHVQEMQYEQNVPWIDDEGGCRQVKSEWLEEQMRLTRALAQQYGLEDGTDEDESDDEVRDSAVPPREPLSASIPIFHPTNLDLTRCRLVYAGRACIL
jgi:hypothetical protein